MVSGMWELPGSCGFVVSGQMLSSVFFWGNSQWEVGCIDVTLTVLEQLVGPQQLV